MRWLAIVLVWALFLQTAVAADPDPHRQALALHSGNSVKVRMRNGDVLQGTLGTVSADHCTLLLKTARTQDLAFADVRSIQRANLRTSTRVLLVAGISVAVAAVVLFILVIHTLGGI